MNDITKAKAMVFDIHYQDNKQKRYVGCVWRKFGNGDTTRHDCEHERNTYTEAVQDANNLLLWHEGMNVENINPEYIEVQK